ncbi:unnamed protein product [Orchesella dallaii]|uniref:Uncharacterized protein n=1 Tax=Orchesella dallaii TaxID=48710 RepID=A0ABP1S8I1_9HEXA
MGSALSKFASPCFDWCCSKCRKRDTPRDTGIEMTPGVMFDGTLVLHNVNFERDTLSRKSSTSPHISPPLGASIGSASSLFSSHSQESRRFNYEVGKTECRAEVYNDSIQN